MISRFSSLYRLFVSMCLCVILAGCLATTRDQQIKRATKKVMAVPFSERGELVYELAKRGELPVDVANAWITDWNRKTARINAADKAQSAPSSAAYRPIVVGSTDSADQALQDVRDSIAEIESLRPRLMQREPQLQQPKTVTIKPTSGGSFYAIDPNTPNSIRYYEKKGNTYYYSD